MNNRYCSYRVYSDKETGLFHCSDEAFIAMSQYSEAESYGRCSYVVTSDILGKIIIDYNLPSNISVRDAVEYISNASRLENSDNPDEIESCKNYGFMIINSYICPA